MASSYAKQSFSFICIAIAALLFTSSQTFAQGGVGGGVGAGTGVGNAFFGVVGGVSVDAEKFVRGDYQALPEADQARIREALAQTDGDINAATELRMISLKGLEKAIATAIEAGTPLPADVVF